MEARQSRKPSEKRERRMQILERTTDKEAPTTFGKNPVSLRLHKIGGGIRPRGGVVELFSRVYHKALEDAAVAFKEVQFALSQRPSHVARGLGTGRSISRFVALLKLEAKKRT